MFIVRTLHEKKSSISNIFTGDIDEYLCEYISIYTRVFYIWHLDEVYYETIIPFQDSI
jgi:starvation-inducible outer membrane lipoprotein